MSCRANFPTLLLIDTGAVIAQVRNIMDQIAQTVSAVFLFTLLSGLVVLYAALLSTQDERSHEAAILRTLGRGQPLPAAPAPVRIRRAGRLERAVRGGGGGAAGLGAGALRVGDTLSEQSADLVARHGRRSACRDRSWMAFNKKGGKPAANACVASGLLTFFSVRLKAKFWIINRFDYNARPESEVEHEFCPRETINEV